MTRVAVTGASGFVGSHAARALLASGCDVVLVARHSDRAAIPDSEHAAWATADIDDETALAQAFTGCESVIHCAGINLERGSQTYAKVHVRGTEKVVRAARAAGVRRIALVSFLRAPSRGRRGCRSNPRRVPATALSQESKRNGLPRRQRFTWSDLRTFDRAA